MPKFQLDKVYIYRGRFYGPGLVDVPEGLALNLSTPANEQMTLEKFVKTTLGHDTDEVPAATSIPNPALAEAAQKRIDQGGDGIVASFEEAQYRLLGKRIPVTDLPAKTPALDLLWEGGVRTIAQALAHEDLTQIRGIGKAKRRNVLEYLRGLT